MDDQQPARGYLTPKPLPLESPWYWRAGWRVWDVIAWPFTVRQLKQAGFRRTGWMTWELRPDGEPDGD